MRSSIASRLGLHITSLTAMMLATTAVDAQPAKTPPVDRSPDTGAPAGKGPAGQPRKTPDATPNATPEATPNATPDATIEATPEATPDATPAGQPRKTPDATPNATPEATPNATPEATPDATPDATIDQKVALALLARAKVLLGDGDYANAKVLTIEALRRSSQGAHVEDAIAVLRVANDRLEIDDPYDGAPEVVRPKNTSAPLDPYGATVDPFGNGRREESTGEPVDPFAADDAPVAGVDGEPIIDDVPVSGRRRDPRVDRSRGRKTLLLYGSLYGFMSGLAVAGPAGDDGDVGAGALFAGLVGAAGGLVGSHFITRDRQYSEGQAALISWASIWAGIESAFLADIVTGVDTSTTDDIYRGLAIGGLLGGAGGFLLASELDADVGDVSVVNSFGLYGMTGSLLVAVALDPTESEAYSINGLVGAAAGIGVGLLAARHIDTSRKRMIWVDIGAAIGAATPWLLVFPLASDGDDTSGPRQISGALSALGMLGGAYLAWRFTRGMDEDDEADPGAGVSSRSVQPPPPGLIQRAADGTWMVGTPAVRPADNPALTTMRARPGLALDVFTGRF